MVTAPFLAILPRMTTFWSYGDSIHSLHCRILLKLQDELAQLEEELDLLDAHFSKKGTKDVDNGSLRRDQQTRKDVLVLIAAKLEQYGMCQTVPTCAQTSVTLSGTLCYRACP